MSLNQKAQAAQTAPDMETGGALQAAPTVLVELGRILGAHGIKGWIKIQPFSSDSEALGASKRWWLRRPVSPLEASKGPPTVLGTISLVWAKPHGANWIACVKGFNDRDQAEALKGHTVLVPRSAFPQLDANEYYWVDLIGCSVSTDDQGQIEHLGVVESVQDSPAHPILMVRQQAFVGGELTDCLDDKGKLVYSLIPFVAAHVGDIDLQARVINVHWPRDF